MYHLSKELTGIVLPHDTFGTHLRNGKTIDEELEKKNFKAAGEVLSEIWSRLLIDKHKLIASVDIFLPHRRISALIPIKRTSAGPVALKLEP